MLQYSVTTSDCISKDYCIDESPFFSFWWGKVIRIALQTSLEQVVSGTLLSKIQFCQSWTQVDMQVCMAVAISEFSWSHLLHATMMWSGPDMNTLWFSLSQLCGCMAQLSKHCRSKSMVGYIIYNLIILQIKFIIFYSSSML